MRLTIVKSFMVAGIAVFVAFAATSCVSEQFDQGPDTGGDKDVITFVVSVPSDSGVGGGTNRTRSGGRATGNGHGPTEGYRNYNADADTLINGTLWGGYTNAEAEAEAFDAAVKAMAANYAANVKAGTVPTTRGIPDGSEQDNHVGEMTILLFNADTDEYAGYHHIKSTGITDTDEHGVLKSFSVKANDLPDGGIPAEGYKVLFFANAADRIASILNVDPDDLKNGIANLNNDNQIATLTATQNKLQYALLATERKYNAGSKPGDPNHSTYKPFVMVSAVVGIDPSTSYDYAANPIELVRNVARINVTTGPNIEVYEILVADYATDVTLTAGAGYWVGETIEEMEERLFVSNMGDNNPELPVLYPVGSRTIAGGIGNVISYTSDAGEITYDPYDPEAGSVCSGEIFTYERAFATGTEKNLSLLIHATPTMVSSRAAENARWYKVELIKSYKGESKHVNILRNYSYTVTISSLDDGYYTAQEAYDNPVSTRIEQDLYMGWPWTAYDPEEGMNEAVYNGEYQLTVDRSTIIIGPEAVSDELLRVFTDYSGGWAGIQAYVYPDRTGWLTPTLDESNDDYGQNDGTSDMRTYSMNTTAASRVLFTATANTGNIRRATVKLTAGELTKTITIIQLPSAPTVTENIPDNVNAFAGAFWRSNQRGERLIRVMRPSTEIGNGRRTSIDGEWNAYVLDNADWIVLDKLPSPDYDAGSSTSVWREGYSGTDGNDFNEAGGNNTYVLPGTARAVSGIMPALDGNYVYFRIGLSSTIDQYEHRYGAVLLVYSVSGQSPKSNLIWIRQGDEPDLLMPVDAKHTKSVPWSPYNLTATNMSESDYTLVNTPNGGGFTEYPSQAGALFQYQARYALQGIDPVQTQRAWHPYKSLNNQFTGWDHYNSSLAYDPVEDETCPAGYRKPSTERNIEKYPSEMIHSLLTDVDDIVYSASGSKANSKNAVHGYYADGFFDRRQIVTPIVAKDSKTPATFTAVDIETKNVAYAGKLFFNAITKASIFFPSSGMRQDNDKGLWFPGRVGAYFGWARDNDPNEYNDRNDAYYMLFYRWGWQNNDDYNWNTTTLNAGFHHDEYFERTSGMSIRCVKAGLPNPRAVRLTSVTATKASSIVTAGTSVMLSILRYAPTTAQTQAMSNPALYEYRWQWQRRLPNSKTWEDIPGATEPTCEAIVERVGTDNFFRVWVYSNANPYGIAGEISVTGK